MNLESRVKAFHNLGRFLTQFSQNPAKKDPGVEMNEQFFDQMNQLILKLNQGSSWFNTPMLNQAFKNWSELLNENSLREWIRNYDLSAIESKDIAVIMAGNVPLVGMHDFLSVLISGHSIQIKLSSKDNEILPLLAKYLCKIEPAFGERIQFSDAKLENYDAVIATGSDNTSRYFEYYFRNKPSLIRRNRNSVAIITGEESEEELKELSNDIFLYYGLGCRNVSKVFVPKDYDFDNLFRAVYHWSHLIENQKYANNYDYNKAVFLMSEFDILDNGFLMLKEDQAYSSPIACLFFEYYSDMEDLGKKLNENKDRIQCLVGRNETGATVRFGQTQNPGLSDYADGIDTVDFLLKI